MAEKMVEEELLLDFPPPNPPSIPKSKEDYLDDLIMDLYNPNSDVYTAAEASEDDVPKKPVMMTIPTETLIRIVDAHLRCNKCSSILDCDIYGFCEKFHLHCRICLAKSKKCLIVENLEKCNTAVTRSPHTIDYRYLTTIERIISERAPPETSCSNAMPKSFTSGMTSVQKNSTCFFYKCKHLIESFEFSSSKAPLAYEKSCQALLKHLTLHHKVPVIERICAIYQVEIPWSRIQELHNNKKGTSAVAAILKYRGYNFLVLIGANYETFYYEMVLLKHRPEIVLEDVITITGFVLKDQWLTFYTQIEIGLWQFDPTSSAFIVENRTCNLISLEELREAHLRTKGNKECIVFDVNLSVYPYAPFRYDENEKK